MRRPLICLVTDRRRLPKPEDVVLLASAASSAGVDLIQVRERDLDDRRLLDLAVRIIRAVEPPTIVVVNERADIARAAGAGGVHLRGDSFAADRLRAVVPGGFLIGRSVHDAAEASAVAATGVDYLVMGTMFATASKPPGAPAAGIPRLERACRGVTVPILAIGGMTTTNAAAAAAAGAAGVAAIGLFSDALVRSGRGGVHAALFEIVGRLRAAFAS